METSERTRLEKLLGMLGSSFDGERANAARMIAAMAEAKKITINELIAMAHLPASGSHQQQTKPPPPTRRLYRRRQGRRSPAHAEENCRQACDRRARPHGMGIQFATDVSARYEHDYELSEKQLVVTEKILRKASRVFP